MAKNGYFYQEMGECVCVCVSAYVCVIDEGFCLCYDFVPCHSLWIWILYLLGTYTCTTAAEFCIQS